MVLDPRETHLSADWWILPNPKPQHQTNLSGDKAVIEKTIFEWFGQQFVCTEFPQFYLMEDRFHMWRKHFYQWLKWRVWYRVMFNLLLLQIHIRKLGQQCPAGPVVKIGTESQPAMNTWFSRSWFLSSLYPLQLYIYIYMHFHPCCSSTFVNKSSQSRNPSTRTSFVALFARLSSRINHDKAKMNLRVFACCQGAIAGLYDGLSC